MPKKKVNDVKAEIKNRGIWERAKNQTTRKTKGARKYRFTIKA